MRPFLAMFACLLGTVLGGDAPQMLVGAHSHNDYKHEHPLDDALAHGFQSVEADVYLVDGELLVAHDLHEVKVERTLQALYLDPLQRRAQRNHGHIYPESEEPFYLLIDLKSEGDSTYKALHQTLSNFHELCTEFYSNRVERRAVTVIVSGNRPRELMKNLEPRLAGYDGRLSDLESADPWEIPWISDNWSLNFQWKGEGEVPQQDREKLAEIVRKAHEKKLQVRFWAIPDRPEAWGLMREYAVDFINTDQLGGLSAYLRSPRLE